MKLVYGAIFSHPTHPTKYDLVKDTPFCHAACMIRKEAYDKVKGYTINQRLLRVEDYHLWAENVVSLVSKVKNIHKPLYQMRDDRNAYSRRKFRYRINETYVKCLVVLKLKLPFWNYCFALRPILVGIIPSFLYDILHKFRLKKQGQKND